MKTMFVYPSLLPGHKPKYGVPPMGMLHIASELRRRGVAAEVLDAEIEGLTVNEMVRRILEVDPADAGAMTKLGVVRMRAGRADEAIALFRKAVDREPANAEALLYLAGALSSTGHPAEAVPLFERARAADPRSTMILNGLGLTRLSLGDVRGAAAALSESLRLDPKQPDVARTLAEIRGGPPS